MLEALGRRPLKVGGLTAIALVLGYSMLNWLYSDRRLDVQTFGLPEHLRIGSWSAATSVPVAIDDTTSAAVSSPAKTSSVSDPPAESTAATTSTGREKEDDATRTVNAKALATGSVPLFPKPEATVDGVREELIKPASGDRFSDAPPSIAKITIVFGGDSNVFERALKTHEVHNRLHGYPIHVLRQQILNDVWTKPAYILSVLLKELAKPENERLKWLFWFDADTVLMNPNIPIELFLPPKEFSHIHLLVTNDLNGLNNGVFPIRVHPWSVRLLSAVVAFTTFRPDTHLVFRDQSALEEVLKETQFKNNVVRLPQRWFNAYQSGSLKETTMAYQVRRGDLLVHFAGSPFREEAMGHWLEVAEEHLPEWEIDLYHSSYPGEIKEFWAEKHAEAEAAREQFRNARVAALDLIQLTETQATAFQDQLTEKERETINKEKDALRTTAGNNENSVEDIDKAVEKLKMARTKLEQIFEQAKRETTKAAYVAIFEIGNEMTKMDDPSFEAERQVLEAQIGNLRGTLVEKPDDVEEIKRQTQALQQSSTELINKIHAKKEAERANASPSTSSSDSLDSMHLSRMEATTPAPTSDSLSQPHQDPPIADHP